MNHRWWASSALAAGLWFATVGAWAFDETKYPDWKGKWERVGNPVWIRAGEKAPLTSEYQAIFDQTTAEQKAGGFGRDVQWRCLPPGMPRIMNADEAMEIVVTLDTIHSLTRQLHA